MKVKTQRKIDNLISLFDAIYFAICKRSIKFGMDFWKGAKEADAVLHKDDKPGETVDQWAHRVIDDPDIITKALKDSDRN